MEADQQRTLTLMPKIILGTNAFGTFDESTVHAIVSDYKQTIIHQRAYNDNCNHNGSPQQSTSSLKMVPEMDTSSIYKNSEPVIGKYVLHRNHTLNDEHQTETETETETETNAETINISTKFSAILNYRNPRFSVNIHNTDLPRNSILEQVNQSLSDLRVSKVDILYIHHPSSNVPILETLHTLNELYLQHKFERLGVCHYSAWEVCEILFLCDRCPQLQIKPSVYQGRYSALRRECESELLPCLTHFGLSFYAFSPTARGLLASKSKHRFADVANGTLTPGKFTSGVATLHLFDYWRESFFVGRDLIADAVIHDMNMSMTMNMRRTNNNNTNTNNKVLFDGVDIDKELLTVVFSWLLFHSELDARKGDAIIIGGSKLQQFQQNLAAIRNAKPLSAEMVETIDMAWHKHAKREAMTYHRNAGQAMRLLQLKPKL